MYLWERDNWHKLLRWDIGACLAGLGSAHRAQGRLVAKAAGLGLDNATEHRASALVDEAMSTSWIEGDNLPLLSVRSSVARRLNLDYAGLPEPSARADGLVEVLASAVEESAEPMTAERLWRWHSRLFPEGRSGLVTIATGRWRVGPDPMRVVSGRPGREVVHFEAPPAERVDEEMNELLVWLGSERPEEDNIIRAGLAHLWFLTIHPFADGNGRIARAISEMVLARYDVEAARLFSLSAQIAAERERYYLELQDAQRGNGDVTAWLRWFVGCIGRAVERAEGAMSLALDRGRFWQRHAAVPLSARQSKVLNRLLDAGPDGFEGGLSTRKYVSMTKTSRATAQREIADLVAKGLLTQRPGAGRSTSYDLVWPE